MIQCGGCATYSFAERQSSKVVVGALQARSKQQSQHVIHCDLVLSQSICRGVAPIGQAHLPVSKLLGVRRARHALGSSVTRYIFRGVVGHP